MRQYESFDLDKRLTSISGKYKRRTRRIYITICACMVTLLLFLSVWIDMFLWKPVKNVRITDFEVIDAKNARFRFMFNKVRNCMPLGMSWYKEMDGGYLMKLNVRPERKDKLDRNNPSYLIRRPTGMQLSSWFIVEDLTESELLTQTHGFVHHRCHVFYTHTTEFFK